MEISFSLKALTTAALLGASGLVMAHGNVTPQPVDTGNLPVLGDEILAENPFRKGGSHGDVNSLAVQIGESAYAGNCAGCHGIRAMSGGLTPDLRELTEWDDEYYMGRVLKGTDRGMPAWKKTLDQNAIWAIRTYVESLPKPE
ncbi:MULTISPECIES: cytochrome c-550 PedF [unclassified Marinobacter]|uniref:cytochrome c-550 PedF n=1 Tax=unclassified Marinobacter TaxID=83889 RepID=UPI0008DCC658|nr:MULTISPECIES: cytochrome c-550 PedF [unclassified Marinobacter]MBQ0834070.1 cytochrome c-550 PedF [Marinobacter sp.]OHY81036.1 cytochrome c-550 PedF [Marinobacter sp. AC-23]|tara:strand:+ start:3031 stop:3459 length:429 start_codon:yes stop_codon:yes gene_type:complete